MKRYSLLAALLLIATPAFAEGTTVDLGAAYQAAAAFFLPIISVLGAAIAGWLANLIRVKFNLDIEAKHREAIQTALTNAAGYALAKGATLVEGKQLDVHSPAVAAAINYALAAAPDAIKYFGITPENIAEKLAAKLGVLVSTNTSVSTGA